MFSDSGSCLHFLGFGLVWLRVFGFRKIGVLLGWTILFVSKTLLGKLDPRSGTGAFSFSSGSVAADSWFS